ncbi:MAG TPA: squalene--hopene cyclase [Opitutaceae bacterium]|nr:squalene--hopene cyclase [Opitutaceae bacterium]
MLSQTTLGTNPASSHETFVNVAAVQKGIESSRDFLFSKQDASGFWCGELEADSMLEADYIFLHKLLDSGDPRRLKGALAEILRCRNEDGSWSLYPGGPGNISLGIKCYFACKLMGMSADDPILVQSREWILKHGGVVATNTFTKLYLCSLGQYDWDACPAIPPEIVLFPNWFYFNLYEISSWSRGILVPLAIIFAKRPFKKIPPEQGISELFVGGRENANLRLPMNRKKIVSWRNFFLVIDRVLHGMEKLRIRPFRKLALKRAEKWMLERLEMSDGLGAIYPAMLNAIVALRALGYGEDHPQVIRARHEFERLGIEQPATPENPIATFRMQPAVSPVWDTAQAVCALSDAGVPKTDPRLKKAVDWLISKEVRHKGDWAVKVPNVEPAGWYFEFANEFYPDTDDTAQVLLALTKTEDPEGRADVVAKRAIDWEFAMQCREGGWGSFDKDCTKMIFENIPFADHNAMLDPPTADITGRMLEMFAAYGYTLRDPRVARAAEFVFSLQEGDGSWFGRWGTNYVYGTFLALRGLVAIGFDPKDQRIQRAAEWTRSVQNEDGGWGETCGTYDDPDTRGVGPSTPSQTAWGVLALLAAGDHDSKSCERGIAWLLARQRADGSWDESTGEGFGRQALYTATGFPKVFYLAYHYYRQYFPLLALTGYRRALQRAS